MDRPTFLFAGGGTGGHLFPGMAVADELRRARHDAAILFAGSNRDVESGILARGGFEHVALSSPPSTLLRRRPLRFLLEYRRACRAADELIRQRQPAAVIGLGGFASVPLVTAAKRRRVPIVLLEQNAVAGRATSRLAKSATLVCHSFASAVPAGRRGANCVVTGNPVRREIAVLVPTGSMPLRIGKPALLVLGGSQGSNAVNAAMIATARELKDALRSWRIVHQCGPRDRNSVVDEYRRLALDAEVAAFFDDLPARYADADLVVSRAGATTLAELACAGLPAVLLPYPNAIRDHQRRNAEQFAHTGAAMIVEQQPDASATARDLSASLKPLLNDADRRRQMSAAMRTFARPDAAARVAGLVLQTAGIAANDHCEDPLRPPHFETLKKTGRRSRI